MSVLASGVEYTDVVILRHLKRCTAGRQIESAVPLKAVVERTFSIDSFVP
jgi:hypothetical protein